MLRAWQRGASAFLIGSSLVVGCGDDDDDSTSTGGRSAGGASGAKGGNAGANQGGRISAGGTNTGGRAVGNGGRSSAGSGGLGGSNAGPGGAGGLPAGGTGDIEGGAGGANGGSGPIVDGGAGGEAGGTAADLCQGIELPAGSYYAAPGLCVRAVATSQGKLRQLTFDAQGSLLGVTSDGAIKRYRDLNGDGVFGAAGEVTQIAATGGSNGNNVHLDVGTNYLYGGTPAGVKRWVYSTTSNDLGAGEDVVTGQPSNGNHTLHTVHVYDGWLYVHSGSADNVSVPSTPDYDTNRSVLKRFRLADFVPGTPFAWSSGELFVSGIRNMVGFTRNQSGRMYGVINGMDDLTYQGQDVHLQNPGEDLLLLRAGEAHGYPYCFTAAHIVTNNTVVPPGTQLAGAISGFTNPHDDAWCAANSVPPVTFLPAHSAPLDITFFDGTLPRGGLPESYRGGAFVSLHGSWNTTPSVGHQIVFVPFDAQGNAPLPVATQATTTYPFPVVFGGGTASAPIAGSWSWSNGSSGESPVRPVGVAISPIDGALYVSSDNSTGAGQGYIYRIASQR